LRNAIRDAKKKYPDKTLVFVLDGGGSHTVEPSTTLRASAMSRAEMETELKAAGLLTKALKRGSAIENCVRRF
jgi:hypothetical protein